ncbi:hypothetical protein MKW92_019990 [Papaver armeniacum]|nr:hypothetical protein MKW92_019990 [Papaver armeniacum]
MAKAHLSLSTFLVGFLLVLIVSDFGLVHGESCATLGTFTFVGKCDPDEDSGQNSTCNGSVCDFLYSTESLSAVFQDQEGSSTSTCFCCANANV